MAILVFLAAGFVMLIHSGKYGRFDINRRGKVKCCESILEEGISELIAPTKRSAAQAAQAGGGKDGANRV